MAAPADNPAHRLPPSRTDGRLLRTIALFKLAKSLLFLAAALVLLRLLAPGTIERLGDWVATLPLAPERHLAERLLGTLTGQGPGRVHLAAALAAGYSALSATEAVGLWRGRRWAEYLTVVATGSALPVEVWELFNRPTVPAAVLLVLNALVVVYLLRRLRAR